MKTKNIKNVTLALLLALCMALFALPAMAQELTIPSTRTQVTLGETVDEQELLDGFALRELYGMRGISTWGVAARETLSDPMKNLYDALKPEIEKVALGQRASTVFTFTAEEAYDMGFNTMFTCAYEDMNAQVAIFENQMGEIPDLMLALMRDCPYDLYWFDQTSGVATDTDNFSASGSYESMTASCGHVYLYFSVSPKFQNGDEYTMDTSFGTNASAAAEKAAQIIENAKSMSDREKLEYYCEQICALTAYDHTAAANPSVNYSLDSNPWQLINVFDGDSGTNVVCEGYAKAFQYLCDETSFSSSSTMSYLVSGDMDGGTGAGAHMWNIVTLGGVNYMVDVTNSDVGSVGNTEYFDPDPLFLSLPSSGTMDTSYTFIIPATDLGNGSSTLEAIIVYTYDEDTVAMWGENILTLGEKAHTCDFSGETTCEYLSATQHKVTVKCTGCDKTQTSTDTHTESIAATCTDAAYCDECKHSYGDVNASAHPASAEITYTDNGDGKHTGSYSCCGATTTAEKHTYGADGKCSACTAQAVAKVGSTCYGTFDEALNNWTDGTTLTLLKDVTYDGDITPPSGTSRTFDGGKYTLRTGLIAWNEGALTISSGTLSLDSLVNYGVLSITGGAVINPDSDICPTIDNYGELYFSSGLVSSVLGQPVYTHVGSTTTISGTAKITSPDSYIHNHGAMTISGGEFSVGDLSNDGTMTISGGSITGSSIQTIFNNSQLTIEGGSITNTNGGIAVNNSGTLNVSGGLLSGTAFDINYRAGTITITGGVPGDGWTFCTEAALSVGTELTLPAGHGLYVNDQIVTECGAYTSGVIRKAAAHTCDFSGEATYEYLSATQHNVITSCSICGATQTIPAGHTETTAATCVDLAYCGDCQNFYGAVNASAHPASAVITYTDNGDGTHTGSYSCCGATTTTESHTLTYAASSNGRTHAASCSVCDYTSSSAPHTPNADKTACTDCQVEFVGALTIGGETAYYSAFAHLMNDMGGQTGTLTLLADYTKENGIGSFNIRGGANMTIDLNGHSFSYYSPYAWGNSNLVVKDSAALKGGFYNGSALIVEPGSTLTIDASTDCEDWEIYNDDDFISGDLAIGTDIVIPEGFVLTDGATIYDEILSSGDSAFLHKHSYSVSGSHTTLSEYCEGCGDSHELTISAPADLTYSGTAKEAVLTGSLVSATPSITYSTADGSAPIDAGSYTASVSVGSATASVSYVIKPKAITAAAKEYARAYDRSDKLNGVPLTLSGLFGSDEVTAVANFKLSGVNVGEYTAAELLDFTLSGADAGNYSLAYEDILFTKATITKASADSWTADVAYGQDLLVGSTLSAIVLPNEGKGSDSEVVLITGAAVYTDAAATVPATDALISSAKKGDTLTLYYRISADNYEDRIGEMKLYFIEHEHSWSYTGTNETITASCSGTIGTCPTGTVTLTLAAPTDLTYSGTAKEATVTVDPTGVIAAPAINYSASPVGAGDYTASITLGSASASLSFTMAPAQVEQYSSRDESGVYTGEAHTPRLNIPFCLEGRDYTVTCPADMTNVGEKTLTVTGIGNYTGSYSFTYEITPASIASAVVSAADQVYTGKALEPSVTVTIGGKTLTEGTDYTAAIDNNVNAGNAAITVTGTGNYEGTATGSFTIAPKTVSAPTFSGLETLYVHTGSEIKPTFTLMDGSAVIPAEEYAVAYSNNVNLGTATITITDVAGGNYTVSGTATFEIAKHEHEWAYSAKDNVITAECSGTIGTCPNDAVTLTLAAPTDLTYSGSAKEATVTVDPAGAIAAPAITYSTADGNAPVTPGKYTATIAMEGVSTSVEFEIAAAAFSAEVTLSPETVIYNGSEQKPAVTVAGLTEGTDYTISSPADMTNAGVKTITITGMGNYEGTATKTFTIEKASLTAADFAYTAPTDLVYNGEKKTATVTTAKTDAAVTVKYSADPVNAGVYTVSIDVAEGTNYKAASGITDSAWTFTIAPKTVSAPTFSGLEAIYVHTGSEVKPAFTLMDGSAVIPAEEYTVAYSNNVNLGTATITITDNAGGNYTVSGTATFEIAEHAHEWTYAASGNVITATCSGTIGTCPIASKTATITLSAPAALTYDGSEKAASVTVDPAGAIAAPAVAYSTDNGKAPVAAGAYTASVTLGDKTAAVNYTIAKASLSSAEVTAAGSFTYTGEAIVPTVTVTLGGKTLTEGADYTVALDNNVNAGTANVTVTGAGSYEGAAKTTFAITPASIAGAIVKAENQVYTGSALTPSVTVALGSKTLTAGTDYEVTAYSGNTAVGTATVTVTGKGNYEGAASGTFEITQSASAMTAAADADTYAYGDVITVTAEVKATGEAPAAAFFRLLRAAKPQMALFLGDTQLTGYEDVTDGKCTLTYDTKEKGIAPADAVTLTVRYTGDANTAEQEATVAFAFTAKEVAPAITGSASKTYDGTASIPADNTLAIALSGVLSGDSVTASAAYALDSADAGEALIVTASGIALTGSDAKFYALTAEKATASVGTITPASIAGAVITADDQVYTGSALTPSVTVVLDGKTLVLNQDYTVAGYENNTLVGTASVTIKGLGNYGGSATGTFEIVKASPVTKAPEGLVASYGSILNQITLPAHDLGTWNWVNPFDIVGNAGEQKHQIVFTPFDTDQYSTVTLTATVSVVKADVTFGDSFKVLLGSEESTVFTYGDTITVTARPDAKRSPVVMSLRAFSAPKANQMALFLGDTQISDAVDADSTGMYTMTVNTADKALSIGENAITAKYVGTDNINDYSQTAAVTLNAKTLTITSVKANNRVYKAGNTLVTVTGAEFDGKVSAADDVNIAPVKGDVGSDAIGAYSSVLLPDSLALTGKDASFYTLAAAASAPTSVEIVAIPADLTVEADVDETFDASDIPQSLKDAGFDTTDKVNEALREAIDELLAAPEGSTQTEPANPIAGTATSFVGIVYIENGEKIEGDPEHFPTDAPLTALLPIPEGTDPDANEYFAAYMTTSETADHKPGEIITVPVSVVYDKNGNPMLLVEITDIAPVMIGWTVKDVAIALPETGDASSLLLWMSLLAISLPAMHILSKKMKRSMR